MTKAQAFALAAFKDFSLEQLEGLVEAPQNYFDEDEKEANKIALEMAKLYKRIINQEKVWEDE